MKGTALSRLFSMSYPFLSHSKSGKKKLKQVEDATPSPAPMEEYDHESDRLVYQSHYKFEETSAKEPEKRFMRAKLFFDLAFPDRKLVDLSVVISQPYGTDYATEACEVGRPSKQTYAGPWKHNEFSEHAEQYYRSLMGQDGKVIGFSSSTSAVIENCEITMPYLPFTIELDESGGGW